MTNKDDGKAMLALLKDHTARLFYRFSLRGYPSLNWEMYRAVQTANSDKLRACVYMWSHKERADLVLALEVLECDSVKNARGYAKGLRNRNNTAFGLKEGKNSEHAHKDLVMGSEYSLIDIKDDLFRGINLSRHNLAFDIRPIAAKKMTIEDLGDLEPSVMISNAIARTNLVEAEVTLSTSVPHLKAGHKTELILDFDPYASSPTWYAIVSDSRHGGIVREGDRIWYHSTEDHPKGMVTFHIASFDAEYNKGVGTPVQIEIV